MGYVTSLGTWISQKSCTKTRTCEDNSGPGWKPVTLKPPLLLGISCFNVATIVVLEFLSWTSDRHGGIAFARNGERFSSAIQFAYLYLPVLIGVSYGMLWSWIDLDVKRLEPFFQMSKAGGASAGDSLKLHYPYDFIAWAPLRAFRRRQWSVVFAGAVVMVVFWGVTPLLGAVFTTSIITRITPAIAITAAEFLPLQEQDDRLQIGILSDAYGKIWLDQAMPDFTTPTAAFTPFKIDPVSPSSMSNESWAARTNMYSTTLTCEPAVIGVSEMLGFTFDDGKGCHTDAVRLPSNGEYTALYIGYYDDPNVDYSLAYLGCPESASHTFLAVWAKRNTSRAQDVTAVFCRPQYWIQSVNVTITRPNNAVTHITPLEPPSLLPDSTFNASAFEYIIGSGIGSAPPRADAPQTTIIEQWPHIQNMSISVPTSNMVGFALGISQLQPIQYFDTRTLASSFESAHKVLFTLAASSIMTAKPSSADPRSATISDSMNAIVVIRVLAVILEVLFGIVTVLAFVLLWISRTRPSQLKSDPASVIDVMRMINQPSLGLKNHSENQVHVNNDTNVQLYSGKLLIQKARFSGDKGLTLGASSNLYDVQPLLEPKPRNKLVRPREMTMTVAILFILVLFLAVAGLTVVQLKIQKETGLPLPSLNPIVVQLVLNYIPIVFATFLEPFWVVLNRLLCILKPFEELRKGEAKLSKSLAVRYTSLPPQLVFWRALRAGHYLLVAVCTMGLSANLLTISLGAMFETNITHLSSDGILETPFLPQFNRTSLSVLKIGPLGFYSDHFYVAKTNITNKTPFPPWISSEHFFLPAHLNTTSDLGDVQFSNVRTQGFGVTVKCTQLNSPESKTTVYLNMTGVSNATPISSRNVAIVNVQSGDGHNFSCVSTEISNLSSGIRGVAGAAELVLSLAAGDSSLSVDDTAFCSSMLLVGFLRANGSGTTSYSSPQNEPQAFEEGQPEAMWLGCRPNMRTAPFEVTVDLNGRILDSTLAAPFSTDLSPFFTNNQNTTTLYTATNKLIESDDGLVSGSALAWHNDTFATTWLSYLIKISTASTDFLSSSSPLPSPRSMAPIIEDLYTRLFSIILGLNTDMLLPAPPGTTTQGSTIVACRRVFMSRSMYIIATALLSANILVAIVYYIQRPKKMLTSMPITIARVLELFQGSGLVAEVQQRAFAGMADDDSEQWKVGYGRFVGLEGKPHVGIERRPFVIPWGHG